MTSSCGGGANASQDYWGGSNASEVALLALGQN